MNLVELVLATHDALNRNGRAHAFGGALALAYYAEPRATLDVDVNVFVPVTQLDDVVAELASVGLAPERPSGEWLPVSGIRLLQAHGAAPVDLFPSLSEAYVGIAGRTRTMPFGQDGIELPFLSAEDLVAFKLSFGRPKDWLDVTQLAATRPDLDVELVEHTLLDMRGPSMHPRLARLRSISRGTAG
jgi:hypothetical protein